MGKVVKLKRGDLRQALIEYALNATKQGHIEVMSLRQAARDLGVSSGAVYRHFADKDALFAEIVKIGFFDLRARFLAIRPEGDAAKTEDQAIGRFFQLAHGFIHWAYENTALWHMMFGRVGMQCRDKLMKDPELARYTPLDVALASHATCLMWAYWTKNPTFRTSATLGRQPTEQRRWPNPARDLILNNWT